MCGCIVLYFIPPQYWGLSIQQKGGAQLLFQLFHLRNWDCSHNRPLLDTAQQSPWLVQCLFAQHGHRTARQLVRLVQLSGDCHFEYWSICEFFDLYQLCILLLPAGHQGQPSRIEELISNRIKFSMKFRSTARLKHLILFSFVLPIILFCFVLFNILPQLDFMR